MAKHARSGLPHSATEYSLPDASDSGFLGSGTVTVGRTMYEPKSSG